MDNIVISVEELRLLVKAVVAETIRELNQTTEAPPAKAHEPQEWLFREEAAEYLSVSLNTLRAWAVSGAHNLPYYNHWRRVRYRREDLDEWLKTRRVRHA